MNADKSNVSWQTSDLYWAFISIPLLTTARSKDELLENILRSKQIGLDDDSPCGIIISPMPIELDEVEIQAKCHHPSFAMYAPYSHILRFLYLDSRIVFSCHPETSDPNETTINCCN